MQLTLDQLALISVFSSLRKTPAFAKFPGSYVLRHYRAGEVITAQGDAGGTAFYMLPQSDLEALAQHLASLSAGPSAAGPALGARVFLSLLTSATGPSQTHEPSNDGRGRRLATARLVVNAARQPAVRKSWLSRASRQTSNMALTEPASISNDGPTDIDYKTRQAPIFEGEVFGEMSCLTRQPRSATVTADTDCFALEFLRNILDQMRKDADYKRTTDAKYRERVLEGHLRQLSIFKFLTDDEFKAVQSQVELVEIEPGTVLWDEGDEPDALYVVRNGIIRVLQAFPWRVTEDAVSNWPDLFAALRTADETATPVLRLRDSLPKEVQDSILGDPNACDSLASKQLLISALNEIAKTDVLLSLKEMQPLLADARFLREAAQYPPKVKSWTGLQLRRGNRVLFHILFPLSIAPIAPVGLTRVLRYLGRGNTFGEISLVLGQPRTGTCVAHAHADSDREATVVELVRVPADVFREMQRRSPHVRAEIDKLVTTRKQRDIELREAPVSDVSQSRQAEDLGLFQGQKLMLIDLDRCTRCGDCVQACIDTHEDGYSRLFLDGPRFGKYLIPSSCRLCRDPVCMIGCPVGSIQQGENGEVTIRDWCIGCGVCERQCPYDSIQMHDTAIVPSRASGWSWTANLDVATTADWNRSLRRDTGWQPGVTPFRWGIEIQQSLAKANGSGGVGKEVERLFFRLPFQWRPGTQAPSDKLRLLVTSQGNSLEVFLNGRKLELMQDVPQKKRSEFTATVDHSALVRGSNLVAASMIPPAEFNAILLDVRLDAMGPEFEDIEEKLVTERAVVCDQCSSLSGGRHACVYACPHEAALRIDTWTEFPQG